MPKPLTICPKQKLPVFWVTSLHAETHDLILDDEEAHHAFRVLRLSEGAPCRVVDTQGHRALCTVLAGHQLHVREVENQSRPFGEWHWVVSWIEKAGIQEIVEHAVLMGVHSLRLVKADESQGYLRLSESHRQKLERVARSTQKLAGVAFQPLLLESSFEEALNLFRRARCYVLHEAAPVLLPGQIQPPSPNTETVLFVGPEAGFSEVEYQRFVAQGLRCFSLGPINLPARLAPLIGTNRLLGRVLGARG
jgi:16S rRNA (uracil1498-N3)-methyltransferase